MRKIVIRFDDGHELCIENVISTSDDDLKPQRGMLVDIRKDDYTLTVKSMGGTTEVCKSKIVYIEDSK